MKRVVTLCMLSALAVAVYADNIPAASWHMPRTGIEAVSLPSVEAATHAVTASSTTDYATGRISYAFPLYTLQAHGLSLDITLSYTTGGVHADAEDGSVGISWVLDCGGMVSRTLHGLPDDVGYGASLPAQGGVTFDALRRRFLLQADSQRDVYSYRAGSVSGNFTYDERGNIVMLPDNDVLIQRTPRGFSITTPDGTTYHYEERSLTSCSYTPYDISNGYPALEYDNAVTEWHLSRIVNAERTDSLTMVYRTVGDMTRRRSSHVETLGIKSTPTGGSTQGGAHPRDGVNEHIYTYRQRRALTEIRTASSTGRITLEVDDNGLCHGLAVIAADGVTVREVGFEYMSLSGAAANVRRHLLTRYHVSSEGTLLDEALFDYYDSYIPDPSRKDFFGYLNDDISVADDKYTYDSVLTANPPDEEDDGIHPGIPNPGLPDPGIVIIVPHGVDYGSGMRLSKARRPHLPAAKAWSLRRFTTALGAVTELEYEFNAVDSGWVVGDNVYPLEIGLRVARETRRDTITGNVMQRSFRYGEAVSDIDFRQVGLSPFISVSGTIVNRRIAGASEWYDYHTTGITLTAASRLPGAPLENATIYYGRVVESVSGTGLQYPIETVYEYDTSAALLPRIAGNNAPDVYGDYRYAVTEVFAPQGVPQTQLAAYWQMLQPHLLDGYFRQRYGCRPLLTSRSVYEVEPIQVYRLRHRSEYSYYDPAGVTVDVGLYSEPIVRLWDFDATDMGGIGGLVGKPVVNNLTDRRHFNYYHIDVQASRVFLRQRNDTDVSHDGTKRRSVATHYEYNCTGGSDADLDVAAANGLLKRVTISCGDLSASTTYVYSSTSSEPHMQEAAAAGRTALPVKEIYRQGTASTLVHNIWQPTSSGLQLLSQTVYAGTTVSAPVVDAVVIEERDTWGNPMSVTRNGAPAGTYTWDAAGTHLTGTVTPEGLATSYSYRPLVGYTAVTTPSGMATQYAYHGSRLSAQSVNGEPLHEYSYALWADQGRNATSVATLLDGTSRRVETALYDASAQPWVTTVATAAATHPLSHVTVRDILGRPLRQYIPTAIVPGVIPGAEEAARAATPTDSIAYAAFTYRGPDSRPATATIPGAAYAPYPATTIYTFNDTTPQYDCRRYIATADGITLSGRYPAGTLSVTEHEDGDGRVVMLFTDILGRTVLERRMARQGIIIQPRASAIIMPTPFFPHSLIDTYYIYDDAGNLRQVITPGGVEAMEDDGTTWTYSSAEVAKHCYSYRYDSVRRLSERRLPACAPVRYWYDRTNTPIFSQDGNQRAQNLVSFSIPDRDGRPAMTGECKYLPVYLANAAQMHIFATRSTASPIGYSSYISPMSPSYHSIRYYDSYSLPQHFASLLPQVPAQHAPGLHTATLTALFSHEADSLYAFEPQILLYDNRERVAKTLTVTHTGHTAVDMATYTNDGRLDVSMSSVGGINTRLAMTYDGVGRLINEQLSYLNLTSSVTYAYDSHGRTSTVAYGMPRRSVIYTYATHGGVASVNAAAFSQKLDYTGSKAGNISAMTIGTDEKYSYTYDGFNRLTRANFSHTSSISVQKNGGRYATTYAYDANSNPTKITRNGITDILPDGTPTYGTVDNLTLTYDGMRLVKADDAAAPVLYAGASDMDDAADLDTEYLYDANGNTVRDANRGITVTYNAANLAATIAFDDGSALHNTYTEDGRLLRRRYITATHGTTTTHVEDHVAGNIVVRDGALQRIHTPHGHIAGGKVYYRLKDYQGNVMALLEGGTAVENYRYYPYGMLRPTENTPRATASTLNPYRYADKEMLAFRALNLSDFGPRHLDHATLRFTTPDLYSHVYPHLSAYMYAAANPVMYGDPSGHIVEFVGDMDDINAYIDMIADAIGANLSLSDSNTLVIDSQTGEGSSTFRSILSYIVHADKSIRINVTNGNNFDSEIFIDSYASSSVDLIDLKKIGKVDKNLQGALIGHFFFELFSDEEFKIAHEQSLLFEWMILRELTKDHTIQKRSEEHSIKNSNTMNIDYKYSNKYNFRFTIPISDLSIEMNYQELYGQMHLVHNAGYKSYGDIKSIKRFRK